MRTRRIILMFLSTARTVARPTMILEHDLIKLEAATNTFVFGLDCLGYQYTTDAEGVADRKCDSARVVEVT